MTFPPRTARHAICVFLAGSLALSGCVTTASRPNNPSQQQNALYDYAESFPAQAALGGAVIGAMIGCGLGILTAENGKGAACATYGAVGAVGGAALGAAGGYIIAENQKEYAREEDRLNALSDGADRELEAARRARAAAERVTVAHRSKIASLRQSYNAGHVSREQLQFAVNEAKYDRDQIARAKGGLDAQIGVLDEKMREQQQAGRSVPSKLLEQRNALQSERDQLDRQIQALNGEIQKTEAVA